MVHLDTSFLIRALVRGSPQDGSLRRWMSAGEELAMSAIAWAEFLCGPVEERQLVLVGRVVRDRVPFTAAEAEITARLFNDTGRRRGTLVDCTIAATALHAGAPLATANPSDFRRFQPLGLRLAET